MSDIHALSGAYAVDALDDVERQRFERHLAECADCRAEVDSLQEAAATLTETSSTTPPAALRDSVLSAISTVRPLPPKAPVEPARVRRFPRLLVAAAAVVALVGGGLLVAQPWAEDDARLTAASVIGADDVRALTVDVGGAEATLYVSDDLHRAALATEDMPAAPDGKVYQVWLQDGDEMVPAGLMADTDEPLLLEGDASDASAAGITVEPEGGSDEPTTEPVVLFPFDQAT